MPDPRFRRAPLDRSNTVTSHPSRPSAIAAPHPEMLPPTIPILLPSILISPLPVTSTLEPVQPSTAREPCVRIELVTRRGVPRRRANQASCGVGNQL